MTSKYAPQLGVPAGLDNVLRDFLREILREQPSNVYQFGAAYFEDQIRARSKPPPTPKEEFLSRDQLAAVLREAFAAADKELNGSLHHEHFAAVLRDEVRLQINERQLQRVFGEADEDDYGQIEYKRSGFVDKAADLIAELHSRPPLPSVLATAPVDVILSKGMAERDFNSILAESFALADEHKTGMLNRAELRRALVACPIGFTIREINILMYAALEDREGMVRIADYLPRTFQLIRHYDTDEIAVYRSAPKVWLTRLMDGFKSFDTLNSGTLHVIEIRDLLFTADLGLTHFQIYDLVAEAEADSSGFVEYSNLATRMAAQIDAQFRLEDAVAHAHYVRKYIDVDIGEAEIANGLESSFNTNERFTRAQVESILKADTAIDLTHRELRGLLAMLDEDNDGFALVDNLVMMGTEVIRSMVFQHARRTRDWSSPPFRTRLQQTFGTANGAGGLGFEGGTVPTSAAAAAAAAVAGAGAAGGAGAGAGAAGGGGGGGGGPAGGTASMAGRGGGGGGGGARNAGGAASDDDDEGDDYKAILNPRIIV